MPAVQLTDEDINKLIQIPKPLPANYKRLLRYRSKPTSEQHEEAQFDIEASDERTFRVMIRKNSINPLDFSVILGYIQKERLNILRLRRYNGIHEHTNKLEGVRFRGFHIHYATQRYQEAGLDIDDYAEPTEKYGTVDQALELYFNECNFIKPEDEKLQPKLLE
jgi:hypothetical protein